MDGAIAEVERSLSSVGDETRITGSTRPLHRFMAWRAARRVQN